MVDAEHLVARVFGVSDDEILSSERHLFLMSNVFAVEGRDPSEVDEFAIKAALAYDELIRTVRSGKLDHLYLGNDAPTVAEVVQSCFSAPARSLGSSTLENALRAVVDHVRASGVRNASEPDR
jgi:hypothetical protein